VGVAEKTPAIRAFVAIELDQMSTRRVARLADGARMASGAPSAVWTPAAKIHVTLKFMAELPAAAVGPLTKTMSSLVDGKRPPRLGACRLGAFPAIEDARVVTVELADDEGDLATLARKLDKAALKYGVAPDAREFRPHVTLARLKRPYDARRWLRQELGEAAGEFKPARLTLFRSHAGTDGASYERLASFEYTAT
jgi:2'-5' RNA ligase